MPKLKDKRREEFCQQYVIDFNGTRAAKTAGFGPKSATVKASQLLTKASIQRRVAELIKDRSERTQITQDMVLQELAALGFSDFKHYGEVVKEFGVDRLKLKTFKEMKGEVTRAIKSITEHVTKDGVQLKFSLHSKERPLELLAKHLGMLIERHELTGEEGGPIKIEYVLAGVKKQKKDGNGEEKEK